MLSVCSLGLGVPFLMAAAFTGGFLSRLWVTRRFGHHLQFFAGGIMIVMGIAMITALKPRCDAKH